MTNLTLTTDRLTLRPIRLQDAPAVFSYRSDAVINRYQGWIPVDLGDVISFIQNRVSPEFDVPDTWFQFVIILKENNEVIGDLGIHFHAEQFDEVELGITLNAFHQQKGFAAEALQRIIQFLFSDCAKQKITASIDPRNAASIRLFERLGFSLKVHIRNSAFINNEWVDDLIYEFAKEDLSEQAIK